MHGLMREGWRKPVLYSTTFNPAHMAVMLNVCDNLYRREALLC